jgi:predicted nucleic acid-binding protein
VGRHQAARRHPDEPAKSRDRLLQHFSALPFISPDRTDHVEAAELRNHCRRKGVQMATIDAVIAQLWIRHDLTLLSTDADFRHAARFCLLRNWRAASDCSPARLSRSIETTRVLRSS